jgi:hypothetical protein
LASSVGYVRETLQRGGAGEVRNVSLLVASAVNSEGFREILGICEGAKEDKSGWSAFLRHLVDRGLTGVQLIISDACRGLMESAAEHLPEARWQRCMVHFYRNVFSHVPTTLRRFGACSWGEARRVAPPALIHFADESTARSMSCRGTAVLRAARITLSASQSSIVARKAISLAITWFSAIMLSM